MRCNWQLSGINSCSFRVEAGGQSAFRTRFVVAHAVGLSRLNSDVGLWGYLGQVTFLHVVLQLTLQ